MAEKVLLPYQGSQDDIDKILAYLKTKPMGSKEVDLKAALSAKYADPRKYGFFDLIDLFSRDNGIFKLKSTGINYLNGEQEQKKQLIRTAISKFKPYYAILEWAYHNNEDSLDADNTKLYWVQHFEQDIDLQNRYRLDGAPLTFFSLCDMGGIGTFIIGRRGGKSRLEINREELANFIKSASSDFSTNKKPDGLTGDQDTEKSLQEGKITEQENIQKGKHIFNFPILGNTAQIVWVKPTFTKEEWTKLKKIGDAMFLDEE
jgi:hypothetical protein